MTLEVFKEKCGYEIDGVWLPRVTSILSSSFSMWPGLNQAAAWGTMMHEAVQGILRGDQERIDAKLTISIEEFRKWYKEHPLHLFDPAKDIEKRVYDIKNRYAGTIDVVAEFDGRVGIIDIKTSTKIPREHLLQTAAYLNAYNANCEKGKACETRWILRIDQYQECMGCLAKRREKYGRARTSEGNPLCNHQWSLTKGEVEWKELENYEKDLAAFFARRDRWEQKHEEWLQKIPNYPRNNKQSVLI